MDAAHETTNTANQQHIYYRTTYRLSLMIFLLMICLFASGALIWKNWNTSQIMSGLVLGGSLFVFVTVIFSITFLNWKKTYIVTSPEGLTKYSPSAIVYTPWNNVIGRTMVNMGKAGRMAALQLQNGPTEMPISEGVQKQQPACQFKYHWFGLSSKLSRYDTLLLIGEFMNSWGDSTGLVQDIRQYAPHSLEEAL